MLVLRRIHAAYTLLADPDVDPDVIARVHGFHADYCPVARSIQAAIEITTAYRVHESDS